MSDAMDSDLREVIRRRIELRERDGHERLLLNHVDLRALLDAADERDRLAGNRREPRDLDPAGTYLTIQLDDDTASIRPAHITIQEKP